MEPGDPHTESLFQGLQAGSPMPGASPGKSGIPKSLGIPGESAGEYMPGIPRRGDPSLRGQVLDVIADIISGTATSSDVRRRLLRQLEDNPGNPEQALLLHILDFEGP